MVRISQNLSTIGLLALLFVMSMSFASADSALEVDYYGGYEAAGTTMQGNLSSAYEVAANEITRWIQIIFDREPLAGEVEGWVTGYFAYMVSLLIDVDYVFQEMARQFFLSAEYAAIYQLPVNRDAQLTIFLTDAYNVFLDRDPSPSERQSWLAGSGDWDLSDALSAIWAAPESIGRINFLFGGEYQGEASENLTSQFFLGVLDRLPTEDELDAWADEFDADVTYAEAQDTGALLATALFGLAGLTDNEDIVTALYRGFFNRFPSDGELVFRTRQLTGVTGVTVTLEEMIAVLAASQEFRDRIAELRS